MSEEIRKRGMVMENKPKRVLAIDFGASSGRAIVGTLANGKITMEEVHRFPNDPVIVNGIMYWDTLRQFYEIKKGIVKAKKIGNIESIGVSASASVLPMNIQD